MGTEQVAPPCYVARGQRNGERQGWALTLWRETAYGFVNRSTRISAWVVKYKGKGGQPLDCVGLSKYLCVYPRA